MHIFDDFSTGQKANLNPKATLHQIDIADSQSAKLIEQIKPDVLSHHAAQMDVRHSVADPTFDARVNILGFINLLEGCKNASVKKVIFASSGGAVYGEQESFPAPESHATQPASPYGVSKRTRRVVSVLLSPSFRFALYRACATPMFTARASRPKGRPAWWRFFYHCCLTGKTPVINGDGKQTRDYVYVGDVVAANVAALEAAFVGPVNIGTGIETDVVTIYRPFARRRGQPVASRNMAGESRANSGVAVSKSARRRSTGVAAASGAAGRLATHRRLLSRII